MTGFDLAWCLYKARFMATLTGFAGPLLFNASKPTVRLWETERDQFPGVWSSLGTLCLRGENFLKRLVRVLGKKTARGPCFSGINWRLCPGLV